MLNKGVEVCWLKNTELKMSVRSAKKQSAFAVFKLGKKVCIYDFVVFIYFTLLPKA